jgi:hypothetical protein
MEKNDTFYRGFEDEAEIILEIINDNFPSLHIWEGYFSDLFSDPDLSQNGWIGFTKEYHQFEGAFSEEEQEALIDPDLYIADLQTYTDKDFHFSETRDVFNAVLELLTQAQKENKKVLVTRDD